MKNTFPAILRVNQFLKMCVYTSVQIENGINPMGYTVSVAALSLTLSLLNKC